MDRAQLDRKIIAGTVVEETADPLTAAVTRCRSWGWPVSLTGSRVLLSTGVQVSAVELAEEPADEVSQAAIDRLDGRGGVTHRAGALVPLPPSELACGQVAWQVPPAPAEPW
ncbi:MAG: hypothetical protein M3R63_18805, partial [Actinomycetota bacterium]|nr:hypothetical protein [Actinomycetota bacterium]